MRARTAILLLLTALPAPGCKSFVSSPDPVARDQEIRRDILWQYRTDPRFDQISVACENRVVTITGRVTTDAARAEAEKLAHARDVGRVINLIEVRPK